jgi:hypothetical protein
VGIGGGGGAGDAPAPRTTALDFDAEGRLAAILPSINVAPFKAHSNLWDATGYNRTD